MWRHDSNFDMKKLLAILVFVLLGLNLTAQVDYSFGNVKNKRDRGVVPTIGVKGGLTYYYMDFAYKTYNALPNDIVLKPGFGVFVEYPIKKAKKLKGLTVGGELMMIERGFQKSFKFRGYMSEVDRIKANYIDVRVPITYYFNYANLLSPYVFVAPDFGLCYGGEFSKTFKDNSEYNSSVNIADSDAMRSYDVSLVLGAGVRYNIHFQVFTLVLKLDGSFNLGLLNTNASDEPNYVDNIAYHVKKDSRMNRGFELMFSVGVPLKFNFLHDSCWGWR